jgi:exodeoxyribonuclease VII small subunit
VQQPAFEDAFGELMETVARLEQGGLTLEESLDGFERGMALYRLCEQLLDQAEQRVTRLVDDAALEVE